MGAPHGQAAGSQLGVAMRHDMFHGTTAAAFKHTCSHVAPLLVGVAQEQLKDTP